MAAETTLPLVSVEEYLSTSYEDGDREYVDGVIVERNFGTIPHSLLQKILLRHFSGYEEMGLVALPDCRTRVASSRFRVPDVMLRIKAVQSEGQVLRRRTDRSDRNPLS